MAKILKISQIFCVLVIFTFGLFYFGGGTYFNLLKVREIFSGTEILFLLVLVPLTLSTLYLVSLLPFKGRKFLLLLLPTAFIIRLVWIIYAPTEPTSDFLMLHNAAVATVDGNFSYADNAYFTKWVYQLGFVMYEAFVIAVFGNETFILKLLNVLYSTGIVWVIYECARYIFNEKTGRLAGAAYTIYIPAIIMTSVLTNQILSTLFFYSGVLLLLKRFEKSRSAWIFIGLLFALGHIIRPVGSLILLATGFFILVIYLFNFRKPKRWSATLKFAGILAVYLLTLTLSSQALMAAGISDYPLENRDPKWKFVLGLNQETTGQYSNEDSKSLKGLALDERIKKEEQIIEERLSDKSALLPLFLDKFEIMWSGNDSSIYWSYQGESERIKNLMYEAEKVLFTIHFILGLLSLGALSWNVLSDQKDSNYYYLNALWFTLFVVGYAMIHLAIEIQTRYRFVSIPSIIIIQSFGHYLIFQLRKTKKSLSS